MAATITTTAQQVLDLLDTTKHAEADRITLVVNKLVVLVGDAADDDVPEAIADDLDAIRYCVEDWIWAGDNCGAQRVRCADVLQRHDYRRTIADVMADAMAAQRVARCAA